MGRVSAAVSLSSPASLPRPAGGAVLSVHPPPAVSPSQRSSASTSPSPVVRGLWTSALLSPRTLGLLGVAARPPRDLRHPRTPLARLAPPPLPTPLSTTLHARAVTERLRHSGPVAQRLSSAVAAAAELSAATLRFDAGHHSGQGCPLHPPSVALRPSLSAGVSQRTSGPHARAVAAGEQTATEDSTGASDRSHRTPTASWERRGCTAPLPHSSKASAPRRCRHTRRCPVADSSPALHPPVPTSAYRAADLHRFDDFAAAFHSPHRCYPSLKLLTSPLGCTMLTASPSSS